jgi:hypothetical protein
MCAALHRADGETRQIEVAPGVEPRHLCRLAPDQRAARCRTTPRNAGDDAGGLIDLQPAGGEVIQEKQRLGALADKIVDLALRRSQVKYRDIWDILYLLQHGVSLDRSLVHRKLADRAVERAAFMTMLRSRVSSLGGAWEAYQQELRRLLPTDNAATILQNPVYWQYALSRLTDLVAELNITTTPNS